MEIEGLGGGERLGFGAGRGGELGLDLVDLASQVGRVDAVDSGLDLGDAVIGEDRGVEDPLPEGLRVVVDASATAVWARWCGRLACGWV